MENIIMLILGVFISVVGIVNIKGNISTIHSLYSQVFFPYFSRDF